jgi:hypothetical protein
VSSLNTRERIRIIFPAIETLFPDIKKFEFKEKKSFSRTSTLKLMFRVLKNKAEEDTFINSMQKTIENNDFKFLYLDFEIINRGLLKRAREMIVPLVNDVLFSKIELSEKKNSMP